MESIPLIPESILAFENKKTCVLKWLGHRASYPGGSASDSGPGLVLDRSSLAKVTDR
ncbi:hypothetical protein PIB30_059699, partial [Stylosanthes scabra]|nr:hypothetical protein [Stylosanthes scabra]